MATPKNHHKETYPASLKQTLYENFSTLSERILRFANRGIPRIEFMSELSLLLRKFSNCDAVELWLISHGKLLKCETTNESDQPCCFEVITSKEMDSDKRSDFDKLCNNIMLQKLDKDQSQVTNQGSFWIGVVKDPLVLHIKNDYEKSTLTLHININYKSIAFIPFTVDNERIGLLILKTFSHDSFSRDEVEFYEGVVQTIGLAVSIRMAQAQLRERIKELTCLYKIAQLVEKPDISLDELLIGTVEILPPAWLYPEIAEACIVLDEKIYETPNFQKILDSLSADIIIENLTRGKVEVGYTEKKQEIDEGPFLIEERNLINEIARQLAQIVERRETETDKQRLQEQLRHADRLATIGQLATGVAHELNEPLGSILGFAQLAQKSSSLADQTKQDLFKIVKAALHAREVVKKLMFFARQIPPSETKNDLNNVIEDGLYFLESRCAKNGVELKRDLSTNIPEIVCDRPQLHQVLINLVVNAIQAMPEGGTLTIQTFADNSYVFLVVKDTGIGMNEEVRKQIFLPFFTTKDINEGTGLGLSVVHGIVTSHRGFIKVESSQGEGTRFEIQLPIEQVEPNEDA